LLSAIFNPKILPHCLYSTAVLPILLQALIQSPPQQQRQRKQVATSKKYSNNNNIRDNSRWTPSQQRLLTWMLSRIGMNQSDFATASVVYDFVQIFTFTTPNQYNRLLSAIYYLMTRRNNHDNDSVASRYHLLIRRLCILPGRVWQ
jgi:hypothetical protein